MVWGSSVPAAPCAQVSSAAQTVSAIQSGVNIVVYQATFLTLPPDPDMGWQMFLKVLLFICSTIAHIIKGFPRTGRIAHCVPGA